MIIVVAITDDDSAGDHGFHSVTKILMFIFAAFGNRHIDADFIDVFSISTLLLHTKRFACSY